MKMRILSACITTFLLTIGSLTANAHDNRNQLFGLSMNGSGCKGATAADNQNLSITDRVLALSDNVNVVCNVPRDRYQLSSGTKSARIVLKNAIGGSGSPIICVFESTTQEIDGPSFSTSDRYIGTGVTARSFAAVRSHSHGAYLFRCTLNQDDEIRTLRIHEN